METCRDTQCIFCSSECVSFFMVNTDIYFFSMFLWKLKDSVAVTMDTMAVIVPYLVLVVQIIPAMAKAYVTPGMELAHVMIRQT